MYVLHRRQRTIPPLPKCAIGTFSPGIIGRTTHATGSVNRCLTDAVPGSAPHVRRRYLGSHDRCAFAFGTSSPGLGNVAGGGLALAARFDNRALPEGQAS